MTATDTLLIYAAPLQGYTEAPFRHFHADIYEAAHAYFSPFLRVEHSEVRQRDLRDITSPLNANHHIIPQIIFRDTDEFNTLTQAIADAGYSEIDLNLGCPFPPQINRGRGAGLLASPQRLADIANAAAKHHGITFSLKMRLGVDSAEQWEALTPIINGMQLDHVTIHPRIAIQQYRGDLHLTQFAQMLTALKHPIIYNGNIATPADICRISNTYPGIAGIMIGRGLLARPSIIAEYASGRQWPRPQRITHIIQLHSAIYDHYAGILCGESQLLSKIKPFWDYLEPEIGHKAYKQIRKSTTITKYLTAISAIDTTAEPS